MDELYTGDVRKHLATRSTASLASQEPDSEQLSKTTTQVHVKPLEQAQNIDHFVTASQSKCTHIAQIAVKTEIL
jgi:hypothetical protein